MMESALASTRGQTAIKSDAGVLLRAPLMAFILPLIIGYNISNTLTVALSSGETFAIDNGGTAHDLVYGFHNSTFANNLVGGEDIYTPLLSDARWDKDWLVFFLIQEAAQLFSVDFTYTNLLGQQIVSPGSGIVQRIHVSEARGWLSTADALAALAGDLKPVTITQTHSYPRTTGTVVNPADYNATPYFGTILTNMPVYDNFIVPNPPTWQDVMKAGTLNQWWPQALALLQQIPFLPSGYVPVYLDFHTILGSSSNNSEQPTLYNPTQTGVGPLAELLAKQKIQYWQGRNDTNQINISGMMTTGKYLATQSGGKDGLGEDPINTPADSKKFFRACRDAQGTFLKAKYP